MKCEQIQNTHTENFQNKGANMSWSMPSNINWSEIDDLYTIVPKGYYKVRIHRTEEIQSKKNPSSTLIKFHCIITEGPHNGSWIHDVMTLPTSADDTKLIRYWKPLAKLTGGNINAETLSKLDAFVFYEPKTKAKDFDNIKFLEERIWTSEKQAQSK